MYIDFWILDKTKYSLITKRCVVFILIANYTYLKENVGERLIPRTKRDITPYPIPGKA